MASYIDRLVAEYGTTDYPEEGFFLLPDGDFLHSGSSAYRDDHRIITSVLPPSVRRRMAQETGGQNKMMKMLMAKTGIIRWMPESTWLEIVTMPTREQLRTIDRMVRDHPNLRISLSRHNKNTGIRYGRHIELSADALEYQDASDIIEDFYRGRRIEVPHQRLNPAEQANPPATPVIPEGFIEVPERAFDEFRSLLAKKIEDPFLGLAQAVPDQVSAYAMAKQQGGDPPLPAPSDAMLITYWLVREQPVAIAFSYPLHQLPNRYFLHRASVASIDRQWRYHRLNPAISDDEETERIVRRPKGRKPMADQKDIGMDRVLLDFRYVHVPSRGASMKFRTPMDAQRTFAYINTPRRLERFIRKAHDMQIVDQAYRNRR